MTSDAFLEFPMEGLAFADGDLLAWLKNHPDPHLWHLLACEASCETQAHLDVLLWIVEQRECDKATAAAVFVATHADRFLFEAPNPNLAWDEHFERIAASICHNSAADFYESSSIADPSQVLERPFSTVLSQIARRRALHADSELRFTPPEVLLASTFPTTSFPRRYVVEQDAVVRLDAYEAPIRSTFPSSWP